MSEDEKKLTITYIQSNQVLIATIFNNLFSLKTQVQEQKTKNEAQEP